MSNYYLIRLIPVGKFFFGGDMTFSVGAKEIPRGEKTMTYAKKKEIIKQVKDNQRYSSYIIKSEKFPQQTSLLGMLRFLLLRNSKNPVLFDGSKIIDGLTTEVTGLIGNNSFRANVTGEENVFGKIKRLSSCFLIKDYNQKDKKIVTYLPMDHGLETVNLSDANPASFCNDNTINLSKIISGKDSNGKEILYSAKDGIDTLYGDGEYIYDEHEIFIEDQRIGINRDIKTGHTEDNALFKQVNYRLADGFCFAFYAELEIDIKPYYNQVVSLGADNSQFVIQISDSNALYPPIPLSNVRTEGCYGKIVLTSSALIDKEIAKKADFAIAKTIPFKYMETNIALKSYHRLSGISYSKKEYLFTTGSVFYFKTKNDLESFKKGLDKRKDFIQIGYNQYQIVFS